jgi:hypothetical protein
LIQTSSGVFLILTLASAIVYLFKRTRKSLITSLIVTSVFLVLSSFQVSEVIATDNYYARLHNIEKQLETCEMAKNQFKIDFSHGDLKYFTFGIGGDEDFNEQLENEYDLEVYHMGCLVNPSMECYNNLVEKELKIEKPKDL